MPEKLLSKVQHVLKKNFNDDCKVIGSDPLFVLHSVFCICKDRYIFSLLISLSFNTFSLPS